MECFYDLNIVRSCTKYQQGESYTDMIVIEKKRHGVKWKTILLHFTHVSVYRVMYYEFRITPTNQLLYGTVYFKHKQTLQEAESECDVYRHYSEIIGNGIVMYWHVSFIQVLIPKTSLDDVFC
uniref:Uncharacterized protein n=1 Tax=viral metagenome TaxID=1070528 RepID=A0A6C0CS89_9ZZZZ